MRAVVKSKALLIISLWYNQGYVFNNSIGVGRSGKGTKETCSASSCLIVQCSKHFLQSPTGQNMATNKELRVPCY